jgi:peptidoglycan/xylan/chitin deacetylase (PgdA/CDA1 family)
VWLLLSLNLAGKIAAVAVFRASPAAAIALWFLPDALVAYHLFSPRSQGLVRSCHYFHTSRREIWLTIDDGPDPDDTPRILAALKSHQAQATFFVIGKNAAAHPGLIRAIAEAGHEIGYHTHTHPVGSFWCASPSRLNRELDEGLLVLRSMNIHPGRFRPPVGIKNLWLAPALLKRRLACIGWSARGLERRGGDPTAIVSRVLQSIRPGSILLLHEGPRVPQAIRVEAIEQTLGKLHQLGYSCVIPSPDQTVIPPELRQHTDGADQ